MILDVAGPIVDVTDGSNILIIVVGVLILLIIIGLLIFKKRKGVNK